MAASPTQPAAASAGGGCSNTCAYANDGECDDGGPNSLHAICTLGTDCNDCGVRAGAPAATAAQGATAQPAVAGQQNAAQNAALLAVATGGAAAQACYPPMTNCGENGACVDVQSNVYNCGECGNVCPEGQSCWAGGCRQSWDINFALEPSVNLGFGGLFGVSQDTFAPSLWPMQEPFGSGGNVGLDVLLRFGGWGLGLRWALQQYGAEADDYMADTLFTETQIQPFIRADLMESYVGSSRVLLAIDVGLGYAGFSAELDDMEVLSVGQILFDSRLSLAFSVFDRLQVGGFAGFGIRAVTAIESFNTEIETGEDPEMGWQVGALVRYTLPLSLNRPPRPPPPPPVPPPPPPPAYVMVVSSFEAATRESTLPEVTQTDAYRQRRQEIRRVAVAAPSNCANERASQATGQATGTGEVLATRCGVEMAELERALTRAGYIVTSWRTIAQYTERVPLEVARDLGAEVLFQINSLERTQTAAATDAELVRSYYNADAYGRQGEPVELTDSARGQLRQIAAVQERDLAGQTLPGAMLDANAIDVNSGQTLWLYRWQTVYRDESHSSAQTLALGLVPEPVAAQLRAQGLEPTLDHRVWQQVEPQALPGTPQAAPVEHRSSVERSDMSTTGGPSDPGRDIHFQLVRRIISDFVDRFQSGRTTGDAAPTAATDAPASPTPAAAPAATQQGTTP